jgi:hypothetical protein
MILFLDFDGVLHPEPCCDREQLFCRMPLLEAVLRDVPSVEIVISSTWRVQHSLDELQQLFSPDIGCRITGVTPLRPTVDPPPHLAPYPRHAEIDAWLKQSSRTAERWIALDDRADWFKPFLTTLVHCDSSIGLTEEIANELKRRLRES